MRYLWSNGGKKGMRVGKGIDRCWKREIYQENIKFIKILFYMW